MKTRSQLSVEIDFDEASRQWNTNKRKIGKEYESRKRNKNTR